VDLDEIPAVRKKLQLAIPETYIQFQGVQDDLT
jgi:hypothetical protein